MKITTEQKDALNSTLHVHVTPEDYKDLVDEQVKKYARQVKMPGFRPGKVPKGMVRKMLGLGVVMEEVSKVVSKAISEHIRDNKLQVLGDPMPVEMKGEDAFDLECTKDIDFDFELGLAPEFELNLNLKDPVKVYEVEIDDALLDKEIHDQRDRHGELIYPETVEQGDIVFGKLTIKDAGEDEEGKLVVVNENRFPENVDPKKVFKPLIGKKVDDSVDFDLAVFGDKDQIMKALMLDEEEYERFAGKPLSFELRRISRTNLAEMNEDFFGKVMPGEEIKDEAAFREKLSENLKKDLDRAASVKMRDAIREALLAAHELPLPEAFLKRWMLQEYDQVNEENVDTEFESMAEGLRWSLIVEKIQQEHPETEVKSEDVEAEVNKSIKEIVGPQVAEDPELEKRYKEHILSNEEMVRNYYSRVLSDRVFGLLEGKITTQSETIPASEFVEM